MAKFLLAATVLPLLLGSLWIQLGVALPVPAAAVSENATTARAFPRHQHRFVDDMILGENDLDELDLSPPAQGNGNNQQQLPPGKPNPPQLWEHGFVYYEISPDAYQYRSLIEKAMRQISAQARCIVFMPRGDEEDYVYIQMGAGCNSYVGRIGGHQELNLDYSCMDVGNIIHELMHVLGFYHEHSRPDRDRYLYIFDENIEPEKRDNFLKVNPVRFRTINPEFDYASIMIYGEYAFSKNGRPTMQPREWTATRLENPDTKDKLSLLDEHTLNSVYKCF